MDTTLGVKTHPDKLLARVDPGLRWQKHRAQLEVGYPGAMGLPGWGPSDFIDFVLQVAEEGVQAFG